MQSLVFFTIVFGTLMLANGDDTTTTTDFPRPLHIGDKIADAYQDCGTKTYPHLKEALRRCNTISGKMHEIQHCKEVELYEEDQATNGTNIKALNECITKLVPGHYRTDYP
ncbi:hypothetical protein WR25_20332, partial [Diploscapter pachys]